MNARRRHRRGTDEARMKFELDYGRCKRKRECVQDLWSWVLRHVAPRLLARAVPGSADLGGIYGRLEKAVSKSLDQRIREATPAYGDLMTLLTRSPSDVVGWLEDIQAIFYRCQALEVGELPSPIMWFGTFMKALQPICGPMADLWYLEFLPQVKDGGTLNIWIVTRGLREYYLKNKAWLDRCRERGDWTMGFSDVPDYRPTRSARKNRRNRARKMKARSA